MLTAGRRKASQPPTSPYRALPHAHCQATQGVPAPHISLTCTPVCSLPGDARCPGPPHLPTVHSRMLIAGPYRSTTSFQAGSPSRAASCRRDTSQYPPAHARSTPSPPASVDGAHATTASVEPRRPECGSDGGGTPDAAPPAKRRLAAADRASGSRSGRWTERVGRGSCTGSSARSGAGSGAHAGAAGAAPTADAGVGTSAGDSAGGSCVGAASSALGFACCRTPSSHAADGSTLCARMLPSDGAWAAAANGLAHDICGRPASNCVRSSSAGAPRGRVTASAPHFRPHFSDCPAACRAGGVAVPACSLACTPAAPA
eukprot:90796-Chlamydomonas_euryale.AAC.5